MYVRKRTKAQKHTNPPTNNLNRKYVTTELVLRTRIGEPSQWNI